MEQRSLNVMAVGAHPDDVEFMMAGTLLLLGEVGARIHVWNLADGCYGSTTLDSRETALLRGREAEASARIAGATLHRPLVNDMAVIYDPELLSRVTAVIRQVRPDILLIPPPEDYMEDHVNTCRLVLSAAFARGLKGFASDPPVEAWDGATVIYHAMPYGLRDRWRRLVRPGQYVDVEPVLLTKRAMLSQHRSQDQWLLDSQGIGSRLARMEEMSREVGGMSGRFMYAEGWRRHLHLGYSLEDTDPLSELLGEVCLVDPDYEKALDQ